VAWDQSRVRTRGICDGQSGNGGRFSPSISVSPANSHSTVNNPSSGTGAIGQTDTNMSSGQDNIKVYLIEVDYDERNWFRDVSSGEIWY
jgi:hypothetical protein